jgi:hypothetical protein
MSARPRQRSQAVVDNYGSLNVTFYAEEPWRYFERRLLHLAEVAQDPVEAMADKSFTVGPLTIEVTSAAETDTRCPTAARSFIAIECEVLLHHTAETMLRLAYAHNGDDPCPLLRMSELRSFADFKSWVEQQLTTSDTEVEAVVRSVFPGPLEGPVLTNLCDWVGMLARHFLDSAPYNAAKHGMTLAGGAEQSCSSELIHRERSPWCGEPPALLEPDDIRGDWHCHTAWSDGRASVEDMARAAWERGYDYLAICDHTRAVGARSTGFLRTTSRRQCPGDRCRE